MDLHLNNLKIQYTVRGDGVSLIVLHGWGASSKTFQEFQKVFSKEGYKVYVLDLPGFGESDNPPRGWGVSDYRDLIHEFTRKLDIEEFFLLGHSFGGRISIKFAAKYPEKLLGLILCASAGIKPRKSPKQIIFFVMAKVGNFIFSLPLIKKLKEPASKLLYFLAREHDYEKTEGVMKDTFKKVVQEDLRPFLGQIKASTLLIWGTEDRLTPLSDGKLMARKIPKAELKIIEGASHKVPYNYLEKTKKIIFNFLNSL